MRGIMKFKKSNKLENNNKKRKFKRRTGLFLRFFKVYLFICFAFFNFTCLRQILIFFYIYFYFVFSLQIVNCLLFITFKRFNFDFVFILAF